MFGGGLTWPGAEGSALANQRRNPEEPAPPALGIDQPTAEELDVFDALDKLRVEAGPEGGYRIHLLKERHDAPGSFARIKAVPLQGFDVDQLPTQYGGGTYLLQVVNQRGQYVQRIRLTFDPDVYPRTPAQAATPAAAPAAPATAGTGDALERMMLFMHQAQLKAEERHSALLTTMLTTMMGAMRPPDPIAQLTALKALGADNPRAPVELIRDAVKEGINIARAAAGAGAADDDDEGGGMARVVEKGIDAVTKILDARATRPAAAAAPQPGKPGVPAVAAGGAAAGPAAVEVPDQLRPYLWLKNYVPYAVGWANQQFSPKRAAGVIYELVPDDHLPALEDFARMEPAARRQILAQLDGRLAAYTTYLDEIAAELIARFDQDATEDEDDAGIDAGAAE